MSDILYLKIGKSIEVDSKSITLGDVASMECVNSNIVNKLKTIKILQIPEGRQTRFVVSVLKIIELIHKEYPALEINNMGETDFVVELKSTTSTSNVRDYIKTGIICLILLCGGAFAIMSFNNDIALDKLFSSIFKQITGNKSDGFTILELMYSIGIFLGIAIFYNHFGPKKVSKDPTPLEVEMRLYENDINTTLVDGVNRRSAHIDVD